MNNNELFLEIKESAKSVNEAYNLANRKYKALKLEFSKLNINIALEEYNNIPLIEREEITEK
ncbi:hypothetical protein, partial [Streptobacillus notomytis]